MNDSGKEEEQGQMEIKKQAENAKTEDSQTEKDMTEDNKENEALMQPPHKEEKKGKRELKLYEDGKVPCPKHKIVQGKGYYFNEEGKFRTIDKGKIIGDGR